MKEKFFKLVSKWRFWLSLQVSLIVVLNFIGHIRAGNSLHDIFWRRLGEAFLGLIGTILGFPSGILGFLSDELKSNTLWFHGFFNVYILPVIYYLAFFLLVRHIHGHKKHWKFIALALSGFMFLSFFGCSRIVEIPLLIA